ncbi:hypothetical protein PV325_008887 [Microctonus aethiopoides]|nr:hypothetical protein PV325_008887 [Microctonus aethiopoides]
MNVVQVFDRSSQKNEKITFALKGEHNGDEAPNIDEDVKKANAVIQAENRNLQMSELQDTITGKDTLTAELRNQVDGLQYELNKVRAKNEKLEHHLSEAIEKLKTFQQIHGFDEKGSNKSTKLVASSVSQTKLYLDGEGQAVAVDAVAVIVAVDAAFD